VSFSGKIQESCRIFSRKTATRQSILGGTRLSKPSEAPRARAGEINT